MAPQIGSPPLFTPGLSFSDIPTHGTPQVTSQPLYSIYSERLAQQIVAEIGPDNVREINYNRRLTSIFDGVEDRRQPDVTVVTTSGAAVLGEVTSPSLGSDKTKDKLDSMKTLTEAAGIPTTTKQDDSLVE